jgi:hypothetical protein
MKLAPPHVWPSIQIAAYHTGAMPHRTMGTPFVLLPGLEGVSRLGAFFEAGVSEGRLSFAHARASGGHGPVRVLREEAIEDSILNSGIIDGAAFV